MNCSGGGNALNYSTSTHVFSCNTISGSGTVQSGTAGQLTWYPSSTNVVGGNSNANISNGTLTLGTASTTLGSLVLEGSSSGAVTLTPQVAAGTPTITYGTSSGTPAVTATAPLSITTATGNISITGVTGEVLAGSAPAFTPTPTLGISSATGAINLQGLTSGNVKLSVLDVAGMWTSNFRQRLDQVVNSSKRTDLAMLPGRRYREPARSIPLPLGCLLIIPDLPAQMSSPAMPMPA